MDSTRTSSGMMAESSPGPDPRSDAVLILAPTGQDAALVSSTLERDGIRGEIFRDASSLVNRVREGSAGVLLLAKEALSADAITQLNQALAQQEAWSDLPVVLMTGRGSSTTAAQEVLHAF